jgi:hypothetical protein
MRDAGFVDFVEKSYYWATNQWVQGKRKDAGAVVARKSSAGFSHLGWEYLEQRMRLE